MRVFTQLMMRKKIPAIYKVLDWLQSSGTQYIDTGIQNNENNSIFVDFIATDTQTVTICGGDGDNGYYANSITNRTTTTSKILKSNAYADITLTTGEHSLEITPSNVVYDGNTISWLSDSGNNKISNIYLFKSRYGTTLKYGTLKLRKYIIVDSNNKMLSNLVPVRRLTDNVVGMYDTVSKTFFTNAGTGSFIGSDEIGYLTVVGSPTISSGIVSDCSSSDYVITKENIPNDYNKIELNIETQELTRLSTFQTIAMIGTTNSAFIIEYGNSGEGQIRFGYVNTSNTRSYLSKYYVPTDTKINIKFIYDNGNANVQIIWNNTEQYNQSFEMIKPTGKIQFGYWWQPLTTGIVDIYNSYIKIDGVKYNFRFAIPLTKVGSPTITDGVVSGFSDSNYVQNNTLFTSLPTEGKIAFTFERQSSMNQMLIINQISSLFPLRIRTLDRVLQFSWVDNTQTQNHKALNYSLVAGESYYVTFEFKNQKWEFNLYSANGTLLDSTISEETTVTTTINNLLRFGMYSSSSYWQGSIDFNNSYIVIDGTKYIFTIGA